MTDDQLKIADDIISMLFKDFPKQVNVSSHFNSNQFEKARPVFTILIDENWIFKSGSGYKLNPKVISIYDKYKSYSNTEKAHQIEIFDFHVSKWKYHTFWWFFALAIFGGGYSAYDLISNLTTKEYDQSKQILIKETQSVKSKSHTSSSDQKNLDSLHNSEIAMLLFTSSS